MDTRMNNLAVPREESTNAAPDQSRDASTQTDDKLTKTVKKWSVLALTILMTILLLVQSFRTPQSCGTVSTQDPTSRIVQNLLSLMNGMPNIGAVSAEYNATR